MSESLKNKDLEKKINRLIKEVFNIDKVISKGVKKINIMEKKNKQPKECFIAPSSKSNNRFNDKERKRRYNSHDPFFDFDWFVENDFDDEY